MASRRRSCKWTKRRKRLSAPSYSFILICCCTLALVSPLRTAVAPTFIAAPNAALLKYQRKGTRTDVRVSTLPRPQRRRPAVAKSIQHDNRRLEPLYMAAGIFEERRTRSSRVIAVGRQFLRWLLRGGRAEEEDDQPSMDEWARRKATFNDRDEITTAQDIGYERPRVRPRVPILPVRPRAFGAVRSIIPKQPLLEGLLPEDDVLAGAERTSRSYGTPLTSILLRWVIRRVINSRAKRVEGLDVYVLASSNRKVLSGSLNTVGINFKALALPSMQITGGANIQITGLDLKVMALLFRRFGAFKRPFEVSGYYVFTNNDLSGSPLIRMLVQNIINATVNKLKESDLLGRNFRVDVLRVTIRGSKLEISGEVINGRSRLPLSARTSIDVSQKGHVIFFKDTEALWVDVFTGTGLPLSLAPVSIFSVDMGDHTRIDYIKISKETLQLRGRFVLSPIPPLVVGNVGKRATFRYDVGDKLSMLFSGLLDGVLTWKTLLPFW